MYNDELMHYGVLGMKWGVRRSKYKAANQKRLKTMYDKNDKISKDFRNSKGKADSYEKTMAYAANKASQLYLRRKDRAKMHADLNDKSKNRAVSIGKAFVKTGLKDIAVAAIPATAVSTGVTFLTGNPILGIATGNMVANASTLGIAGTRIYNTAKNK